MNAPTRRHFLLSATGAAAVSTASAVSGPESPRYRFCTFTKFFQHLSYAELAEALAPIGLHGIEAPIRPRGHIEPAAVPDELPKMVEALKGHDLEILVFASGINEVAADQHTESILRTAAALGIPRYRMGYYKYDLGKPIRPQLDEIRPRLADLAALNRELGIQAVYQNHSGKNYVGGPIWDIHDLVRQHEPREVALAFDIGHATVEGGYSWQIDFGLARSHLGMVYVKDFTWDGRNRKGVPLGQGNVSPEFFKLLRTMDGPPPISLHVEYLPKEKPSPEVTKKHVAAITENFATLKQLLDA